MHDSSRIRFRGLQTLGGPLTALLLAGCLFGPPNVPPSGALIPSGQKGGGPRTSTPFGIAYAAPRGEVSLLGDQTITVIFNRGMRAIEAPDNQDVAAINVRTLEGKPIPGQGRWVGTRGLLFEPQERLPGGSRVAVTVPAAVLALDGTPLGQDYVFEFVTPALGVVSQWPTWRETSLSGTKALTLDFNQDVSVDALKQAAHLTAWRNDGDPRQSIPFHIVAASPDSRDKRSVRQFQFVPDQALPYDSQVALTIDAGLRGLEGPAAMEKPFTLKAHTTGPLRLESFFCTRQASQGKCRAHHDIKVTFSNPVTPSELKAHLKTANLLAKPDAKKDKPRAQRIPQTSREHWLGADPQLGKRYKVTFSAGMKDVYGQALAADTSFELDVELPFAPLPAKTVDKKGAKKAAPKPVPGPFARMAKAPAGVAAADNTRPHRPRFRYDLQIGLHGHLVEALANTGVKSHKVPIGSVNIPSYQMRQVSLNEAQAMAFLGRTNLADFLQSNHVEPQIISPGGAVNTRTVKTVDLDALLGKTGRGTAILALDVLGDTPSYQEVTVTDLGISAKASRFGSLVWVTSLSTGKPVVGAAVALRTTQDGELYATKTDDRGVAEIPADKFDPFGDKKGPAKNSGAAYVFVRSGDDWTYQRVERSSTDRRVAGSLQDFNAQGEILGMTYTERGIYRPGETIKMAGIFRLSRDAGLKPMAGEEVRISADDARGETVFTNRVKLDAFGAFAADVNLPKSAHLGESRVVVTLQSKGRSAEVAKYFLISDYKPSEFKVEVTAGAPSYIRGDKLSYDIKGEYLFGGPMAGATAHTNVTRALAPFTPPHTEGCAVTDEGAVDKAEVNARAQDVTTQDDTLDATGNAGGEVLLAMPGQSSAERVMVESEVEDLSHQTVANRTTVMVHPAEFYLALKRPKERFVSAGAPLRVELAAVEPSGARRIGAAVKVELIKRTWTSAVEEHGAASHRTSRIVDEVVGTCDVRTETDLRGCEVKVPEAAYYVVRAGAKDGRDNPTVASYTLYAVETTPGKEPSIAWGGGDTRSVKLAGNKDKGTYEIGETAKFLVESPFREAEALVTVERNGVLSRKVVHMQGPMPTVDIPVTPEMYPNAFVAVHMVRGRIGAPPDKGADLNGPDFRMGYAELKVNPEAHRLAVTVKPAKVDFKPGEEVDVDVSVADREGKPAEAELTFFAVDEGVLMLTGFQTPDPLPAFVKRRSLAVYTVEAREQLAHILPMVQGERVPILGYEYMSRGDKGYPGGGGAAAGQQRSEFRSTAYFEAGKVTNREGKAHVHFKLPDNLTSFRLMAVAASRSDYFGSGEAKIVSSKKLMARPAVPRFLRAGDSFAASVVVTSKELPDVDADVSIGVRGLTLSGETTKRVHLTKNGNVEVTFPVSAKAAGDAELELTVRAGGETDSVKVKRKVDLPLYHETLAAYGETGDGAVIALGDLKGIHPDAGELRMKMSPTALVGLSTSMEELLDYPYGCTEQLASRTLPLVALGDLAKDMGVRLPANVPKVVEDAVEAILKNQQSNGGFGFWPDSQGAEAWLSAYVTLVLDAAKKAGYKVSGSALESAQSYLRAALSGRVYDADASEESTDDTEEPAEAGVPLVPASRRTDLLPEERLRMEYANAAFLADALAVTGSADAGYLTRLYDIRRRKPVGARALLLHAMVLSKAAPEPIATLAQEIEQDLRVDASSAVARVDPDDASAPAIFETQARATALVLRGLLAANPKHPLAPRLARGLVGLRENGIWRSTQDNGWALLALSDYRTAQEGDLKEIGGRAYVGGSLIGKHDFEGAKDIEATFVVKGPELAKVEGPVSFAVRGEGRLFYAAELKYATAALPRDPKDMGLFVKKMVRAAKPEDLKTAIEWIPKQTAAGATVGELVLTDLLLESSETRRQVVIDDPLPAGVEAVDIKLATTSQSRDVGDEEDETPQQARAREERAKNDPNALGGIGSAFRSARVHREMKDDRVLTFIEHLPPGMYHFRYLGRATAVGQYVVPPTRVSAMYTPEIWGATAATSFEVKAKP